ncbi:hypothetical protein D9758_003426 [Tetrapyrgos nigripes]|uniref:Uncharacterized protein n=1 Tax=Tetrapyrgos nigripes TaxID=182062 RepID=A0A8H5GVB3_9AGAR|nr:hypothetical protein D9758_003426 [Tetrapyrgos nigripes]
MSSTELSKPEQGEQKDQAEAQAGVTPVGETEATTTPTKSKEAQADDPGSAANTNSGTVEEDFDPNAPVRPDYNPRGKVVHPFSGPKKPGPSRP